MLALQCLPIWIGIATGSHCCGEFLIDKLRSGKFLLDATVVHAHTFNFCVKHLVEGPSKISRGEYHYE